LELDPLSNIAHYTLGASLYASGQFDQSLEESLHFRKITEKHLPSLFLLVYTYIRKEMFEEAMDEISKGLKDFHRHPLLLRLMGYIYAQGGENYKTQEILDELIERSKTEDVSPLTIASLYADLGETDQSYRYLEEGYEKRDIWFVLMTLEYRNDPRFDAFYKMIGL